MRFFFFNDTATTEIYTLSLHDALPISRGAARPPGAARRRARAVHRRRAARSEEHTSELQSRSDLVCRLLLEKKKNTVKEQAGAHRDSVRRVDHGLHDQGPADAVVHLVP